MLTLVSIVVAFLLFGLLDAVRMSFTQAGQSANGAARLHTASKLSFIQTLPQTLGPQIATVDGVKDVTFANWFGGAYREPRNQIFAFAVPHNYLDLLPEIAVANAERKAFLEIRNGALVGEQLVRRFNWKVGDRVSLLSTIYPDRNGNKSWQFEIVGALHATDKRSGSFFDQMFLLNWKYFDDTTPLNQGQVGWYVTRVAQTDKADQVAKSIDALSSNTSHETRTQNEQAVAAALVKQLADVGLIVGSIMGAVFFTLMLVSSNTMIQSVRERTSEIAILTIIGFTRLNVSMLILAESILLLLLGGTLGLALASAAIPAVNAGSGGMLNLPSMAADSWIIGILLIVAIGTIVGAMPAWNATRLNIVDALAKR
jgi:putative ABC transport system permease protein